MSSTFPEIIPALSTAVVNGATNVSGSNGINSRKGNIHGIVTTKSNGSVSDTTIVDATATVTTTETTAEATSTYHCTFNDDDTKVDGNLSSITIVTTTQTRDDPQAENQSVSSLSVVSGSSSDHNVKSQDNVNANANGFVAANGTIGTTTTITTATVTAAAATKERKKRTNSTGNRLSRVFSISSATEKDNAENDASTISSSTTTATTTPQQEKRSKRRSFRLFSKGEGKQEKQHVDTVSKVNITSSGTTTIVVANPGIESMDTVTEAPTATVTARPTPDPLTKSKNDKHRRSFTEMFNRSGSTLEKSGPNVDEILRRRKKTAEQEKKKRHSLNLAELLGFSDGYELSDSDSNEEEVKKESKEKQQRKKQQQQQQQQQQQKKKKRHSLNLAELLGFSDDDVGAEDNEARDHKQRNKRLNVTEFLNSSDDGNKDGVTEIEKKRRNLNISDIIRYRHQHSKVGDSLEQVISPVDFSATASPTILNGRDPHPLENGGDAAVETTITERPKSPVGYEDSYYISTGVSVPDTSVADEQTYFPSGTNLLTRQENHISSETATSSQKKVNNTPLPPPIFTMPNSSLITSETQQGSSSRSTNATSSNVFTTVLCDSPQSPRWPQDWKQDVEKRILPVIVDDDQEDEEEDDESEHGSTFVNGDIRKKLTELETANNNLLNEKSKLEQEVQQQSEQIAKLSSLETTAVQLEQTVRQLEQKINKQDDDVSGSLTTQRLEETIQRLEAKLDAQNEELGALREVVGDLRSTQSPITDKPNHITEQTTTQHPYRQLHRGIPDSSLDTTPPTTPTEQPETSLITTSTSHALVNTTATLVDSLVVSPLRSSLFIASAVLYTVYVRPVVGIANILQQNR